MSRFWYQKSLGLLLLRVVTGAIFLHHGWMKFGNPMIEGFFQSLGLSHWVFVLVATVEVVGGLMLILGVAPRVAGVALGVVMATAVFLTGFDRGLAPHEFEFILLASSLCIALAGSGKFSLCPMECRDCGGMLCKGECR